MNDTLWDNIELQQMMAAQHLQMLNNMRDIEIHAIHQKYNGLIEQQQQHIATLDAHKTIILQKIVEQLPKA